MFGIDQTIASFPEGSGRTPMGMLRPSAKSVAFDARPSGRNPSSTVRPSCGATSAAAANGYSTEWVTQSRPRASNAMFIGFWISGSLATSWISKPGGSLNFARSSAGERASVGATGGLPRAGRRADAPKTTTNTAMTITAAARGRASVLAHDMCTPFILCTRPPIAGLPSGRRHRSR